MMRPRSAGETLRPEDENGQRAGRRNLGRGRVMTAWGGRGVSRPQAESSTERCHGGAHRFE
ncbi:hypothetical protein B7486_13770 [cyanobacterium TDX16]|nr:hypothetical protein B7486_13770 [cyanobacterium TDX16]